MDNSNNDGLNNWPLAIGAFALIIFVIISSYTHGHLF